MGIDPRQFGPYLWATIHLVCLGAPDHFTDEQKNSYANFINSLPAVIPCSTCSQHLHQNLADQPVEAVLAAGGGSPELFKWSVDLHNRVNTQLSKTRVSYEDAYTFWRNVRAPFSAGDSSGDAIGATGAGAANAGDSASKIIVKNNLNVYLFFIIGLLIGIALTYGILRK